MDFKTTLQIYGINTSNFTLIRDLIHSRSGIYFEDGKLDILAEKVSQKLVENNLTNFLDYYYKLKYDNDYQEWLELIKLITINETYFYREFDHIKLLVEHIIPEYFKSNNFIPLKIWSAACSTREEPLSIAMAINEKNLFEKYPIKIFASDINSDNVEHAKKGVFRERSFRVLPLDLKEKYFTPVDKNYKISNDLLERVEFFIKNLFEFDKYDFLYMSDVIFIRNALIYFSDQSIIKLINYLYDKMPENSYLIIGVSESLLKYKTKFELIEINNTFVYKKVRRQ